VRAAAYTKARNIGSLVPGVGQPNVDLMHVASPHDLADLDIAILPGEFAVAENGAVWVTDEGLPHRVVFFLAQHLVLVVPAGEIVDHMHAAYERLAGHEPQQMLRQYIGRPILGGSRGLGCLSPDHPRRPTSSSRWSSVPTAPLS